MMAYKMVAIVLIAALAVPAFRARPLSRFGYHIGDKEVYVAQLHLADSGGYYNGGSYNTQSHREGYATSMTKKDMEDEDKVAQAGMGEYDRYEGEGKVDGYGDENSGKDKYGGHEDRAENEGFSQLEDKKREYAVFLEDGERVLEAYEPGMDLGEGERVGRYDGSYERNEIDSREDDARMHDGVAAGFDGHEGVDESEDESEGEYDDHESLGDYDGDADDSTGDGDYHEEYSHGREVEGEEDGAVGKSVGGAMDGGQGYGGNDESGDEGYVRDWDCEGCGMDEDEIESEESEWDEDEDDENWESGSVEYLWNDVKGEYEWGEERRLS